MTPEQCEFLAGNEWIQINPQFSLEQLHLISGDIGPFEAGMPVWVPLWVAITLRKRRKCTIIPPDWLCVDEIKKLVSAETGATGLAKVPRFYLEIAHMFVQYAKEDLPNGDMVLVFCLIGKQNQHFHGENFKRLAVKIYDENDAVNARIRVYIQDLWERRSAKLNSSTFRFLGQVGSCHARMDNITSMEIAHIKPALTIASREIEALNKTFQEISNQNSGDQRYVVV